jgi:hypothetical protein
MPVHPEVDVSALMVIGGVRLSWRQFDCLIELCSILPLGVPYRRSDRIAAVFASGEDAVTAITPNDVKCWDSVVSGHSFVGRQAAVYRDRSKPTPATLAKIVAANNGTLQPLRFPQKVAMPTQLVYDAAGSASCPSCGGCVHMGWQNRGTQAHLSLQDLTAIDVEVVSGQCAPCRRMFEYGKDVFYVLRSSVEGESAKGANASADPLGPPGGSSRPNAWNCFSRGKTPAAANAGWNNMDDAEKEGAYGTGAVRVQRVC